MNNWYVITGAPCSGKTTVLNSLKEMGYEVIGEVARTYIDKLIAEGLTIRDIRKDETRFQNNVLDQKYKLEEYIDKDKLVFFDRGIPDSYAYFKFLGIKDEKLLRKSLVNNYKKVFILEPCPYKKDYARTESEEDQIKLHELIQEAYKISGAEIINVPIFETKKDRVDFVLNNL